MDYRDHWSFVHTIVIKSRRYTEMNAAAESENLQVFSTDFWDNISRFYNGISRSLLSVKPRSLEIIDPRSQALLLHFLIDESIDI